MTAHIEHEWSEDGQCRIAVTQQEPNWEWRSIEVLSIAAKWLGGVFSVSAQAFTMLGTEIQAAAEHQRCRRNEEREAFQEACARAEMAGSLEGMILWDDVPDSDR